MGEYIKHIDFVISLKIPYYHILGNHEFFKPNSSKYHALQSLIDHNPQFYKVVDERFEFDNITMMPYVHDFKTFPLDNKEILICHQTFIGADYGFKREDVGVNADKISSNIIISGHIHKRQTFGKVNYVGTPFAGNSNDVGQIKGLSLFDTSTYNTTLIESPLPKWSMVEFSVTSTSPMSDLHKILIQTLNITDKWIIKASGPKAELTAYFQSKEYLNLIKDKQVISKTSPTDKIKTKIEIKSASINSIIAEYIDKVYDGSLDKQLITRKVEDIIKR